MGKLVYGMNVSLDGYIETQDHSLDWTIIDEEIHNFWNDQTRGCAAMLYGRRLYETMAPYWPHAESDPNATDFMRDFARAWLATPKIVFSSTLESVDWNSRLVRGNPVDALPRLRAEFDGELSVAGPTLASAFVKAGLVDEFRPVVHPVILGAGTPFFPPLEQPLSLRLMDSHRFASGACYLRYGRI